MAATEQNEAIRTKEGRPLERRRFVGNATNKIDAKGRVSIPADMRRQIDAGSDDPAPVLFCAPSILADELLCGGADLKDYLLYMVAGLDLTDPMSGDRLDAEEMVLGLVERLYFDEAGRVVVPKALRDHAQLSGPVSFVGRGDIFVMADAPAIAAKQSRLLSLDPDTRNRLRARMSPARNRAGGGE
ncbi:hypothetical protein [Parvularcula sp. LCG005]|uniref:division/cell wall cluster transcriptional repressor MraZ n=1 Tax=Parvularcula sp. LCG005 TaxID=3078805 RepID=UPI002941BD93|nr:hypothetical protein [Parvularcula sp. LCG005]WOI52131.1 hypothetical protein RUI03_08170 [Parvularcula sp. LCG005]